MTRDPGYVVNSDRQPDTPSPTARPWHALDGTEALARLGSRESGLTAAEVAERRLRYGANEIRAKRKEGVLRLLWRQINNPLIWVLLGSGTLAMALGKITDGMVVLSVVGINAIIGFIQEFKAGQAIEALSGMVPRNAAVLRDGRVATVPAADLVPGDVVQLAAGDNVPADMRLLSLKNLRIEEAALTGESAPVEKGMAPVNAEAVLGDRACMLYGGTMVVSGMASAVVIGTGMATELGRISQMIENAVDLDTPLTRKLAEVSQYITVGIILVSLVILAVGLNRALDQSIPLGPALKDTLIFAIALAVGAIPEGLPAVVTIALAIGVQRMARRNAIIRKLPAVETLGSTTVICSDKTGTLTRNEMTVTALWTLEAEAQVSGVGYAPSGHFRSNGRIIDTLSAGLRSLLQNAALCNDAALNNEDGDWVITGDPTEAALLVAAAKAGMMTQDLLALYPRLDAIPFASEHQFMATLHDGPARFAVIKGAPEVVLGRCSLDAETHQRVAEALNRMGGQGMRVLAVAAKEMAAGRADLLPEHIDDACGFLGLIGMIDPPRDEAIAAIEACHRAGIVVKMITGDHRATALAIGAELRLAEAGSAVTGVELAAMDEASLEATVRTSNIFARVAPEHKLRLVRALQRQDHVVAMTGDGVNDAPSLKQANIGVAMGITGTAVSRESADIVLADDNFASIGAAVEEGRRVYDNLIKSLAFLLPTNLGLALILMYGIMFFPFDPVHKILLLPMLPAQLLWINLVAAVTLALPLAFEVKEPDIMRRPPRRPDAPLFSGFIVFRVAMVSMLMTAGAILLFNLGHDRALAAGAPEALALARAQTMTVTFVIFFQVFYMIHCRSLRDSLRTIGLFGNPAVFWGIGVILALQALLVYVPMMQRLFRTASLGGEELLLTLLAGFVIFPVITLEKWVRGRADGGKAAAQA